MLDKLEHCRIDRIENCVTAGMPDVCITYNGSTYWYELKVADGSKGRMTIGAEQRNWHSKELKAGGKPYVLAYNKDKKELYRFVMPKLGSYIPEDDKKLILNCLDLVEP